MAYVNNEEFERMAARDKRLGLVSRCFHFLLADGGFHVSEVFCPQTRDYDYRDGSVVVYSKLRLAIRVYMDTNADVVLCWRDKVVNPARLFCDRNCANLLDVLPAERKPEFERTIAEAGTWAERLELLAATLREFIGTLQ